MGDGDGLGRVVGLGLGLGRRLGSTEGVGRIGLGDGLGEALADGEGDGDGEGFAPLQPSFSVPARKISGLPSQPLPSTIPVGLWYQSR